MPMALPSSRGSAASSKASVRRNGGSGISSATFPANWPLFGLELAALAQVSNATVSRFIRRLGYESYEEARRHARAETQTGSRLFLARATDARGEQSVQAHAAQGIANLEATFQSVSEGQINSAVEALLGAGRCGCWVSAAAILLRTISAGR